MVNTGDKCSACGFGHILPSLYCDHCNTFRGELEAKADNDNPPPQNTLPETALSDEEIAKWLASEYYHHLESGGVMGDGKLKTMFMRAIREAKSAPAGNAQAVKQMLALRAADKMAWVCDVWVQRHVIDARSALADARLSYGEPFRYSWSKLEAPSVYDSVGEHVSEYSNNPAIAPSVVAGVEEKRWIVGVTGGGMMAMFHELRDEAGRLLVALAYLEENRITLKRIVDAHNASLELPEVQEQRTLEGKHEH